MRYKKSKRRHIDRLGITIPEQSLDLRTVFKRISKNQAINARIRTHVPLPPDGEDEDDYNAGTREILDPVDVLEMVAEIDDRKRKIQEDSDQRIAQRKSKANANREEEP